METIQLDNTNTFEITDEILDIMTAQLEDDSFDWDSVFAPLTDLEKAEIEAEKLEREKAEEKEMFERKGILYDSSKKYKSCRKCSGNGKIDAYSHVSNGVCYNCGGTGKV